MAGDTINGIPRVALAHRPLWKRQLAWWAGGKLSAAKPFAAGRRKLAVPLEVPLITAAPGRVRLSGGMPVVALTSTGAAGPSSPTKPRAPTAITSTNSPPTA